MKVMGLDPSLTAFGWAILDSTATGTSRRLASGHEKTLPSQVSVTRYMHFRNLVRELILKYDPQKISIESAVLDGSPFSPIHYGLVLYSLEAIFEARRDVVLFDPSTLKSLISGHLKTKRKMFKSDMQNFVKIDTMDTQTVHDGEADAYCLAYEGSRFFDVISGEISVNSLNESEIRTFISKKKTVKTLKGKIKKNASHAFRENSRWYNFSKIPNGTIALPEKSEVHADLLSYLAEHEET